MITTLEGGRGLQRRSPGPPRTLPNVSDDTARAHDAAVAAGEPGYIDPVTGLFVLTAAYLRERGECCGNGCRHCPYGEEP